MSLCELLKNVVILGSSRTPIGSFRGSLASKSATELGSIAIKGALNKAGVNADAVDEVIMGNVLSANLGQAPARQAALKAGLSNSTICTTVNKVCASGLKAVMFGAQSIVLGTSKVVVAGGMESMSNAPHYLSSLRGGQAYGNTMMVDSILIDGLTCGKFGIHMGECTEETLVKKFGTSREEQDEYAIQSYQRAAKAIEKGLFKAEIEPVLIESKKGNVIISEDEEYKKADFTKFPKLKPAFKANGGTITAANASTINDGASAVVIAHKDSIFAKNTKPLARILAMADAECDPREFGLAPTLAIPKALAMAGNLGVNDIDFWEINEAFSAVAIANIKTLNLDPAKVNAFGGAVSLGHPIGSSGCRLLVTLVNQLQTGQKGCVAICNGGGGASAMIIERL